MPSFPGLTREEEEDREEHMQLQLLSLLDHKNEHVFFSEQFKHLIKPKFKAKKFKEADPEWRPGAANPTKRKPPVPRPHRPKETPTAPPPGSPAPSHPSPVALEENLSSNLADFAAFFDE